MSTLQKNHQIEILRGISILVVFFFHLKMDAFRNGFLGVDIFFVISGFLMALIYFDMSTKEKVLRFYKRRLDRLLPAYFAVLAITIFISAIITLPYEYRDIMRHGIWSDVLAPNIGFWTDNSYFNEQQFKPFLNFWSLGVEIQFYLLFPFLIWIYNKAKPLFYLIALGSFIGYVGMDIISPKTSFFMTPLRLWQFVLGFYAARLMLTRPMRHPFIGLVALFALLALMALVPNVNTGLPLWAGLLSALTAIVIVTGLPDTLIKSFPARGLEILGKYSYSIYLVHFPVIAFFIYTPFNGIKGVPDLGDIALITLVTAVLSVASYHLIEQPLRHRDRDNGMRRNKIYAVTILFIFALIFGLKPLNVAKFSTSERQILSAWFDRDSYRCGKLKRLMTPLSDSCLIAKPDEQTDKVALLVGSSHADAIKQKLAEVAVTHDYALRLMKLNTSLGQGYSARDVLKEAQKYGVSLIVIQNPPPAIYHESIDLVIPVRELLILNAQLKKPLDVAWVDPVPVYGYHIPETYYKAAKGDADAQAQIEEPKTFEDYDRDITAYTSLDSINSPHFERYEVGSQFCRPDCIRVDGNGNLLYFDTNHLTLTGAQLLEPVFDQLFTQSK